MDSADLYSHCRKGDTTYNRPAASCVLLWECNVALSKCIGMSTAVPKAAQQRNKYDDKGLRGQQDTFWLEAYL